MTAHPLPFWVLAAQPGSHDAEERSTFTGIVREQLGGRDGGGLLVTCHRVELYGVGGETLVSALEEKAGAHGLAPLRRYRGQDGVRHLLRLAAGLESAVTGEDEILHQVRGLLDAVRESGHADPAMVRALELALGVGRRARAERSRPRERSLADRALDWVATRGGQIRGGSVVVAGAGVMGRALAAGAARRGASVTVASRDPERARALARAIGGSWASLGEAATHAMEARVLLIALGGRWDAFADQWRLVAPRWSAPDGQPPLTVDLSSPPAIPEPVRAALGEQYIDVDHLFARGPSAAAEAEEVRHAYVEHAERLVDEACKQYARWIAARPSVATLRSLRASAEEQRARELERLFRRLPGLDARERELVAEFSEQLVARLLHGPSARLHDDTDGAAAEAARRLFDL